MYSQMRVFCFVLLFIVSLILGICSQESPCPNVFQYGYDGFKWYGTISIPSPGKQNVTLVLVASIEEELDKTNTGHVQLLLDNNTIVEVMNNGGTYLYKYHFPTSKYNNLPTIKTIKLNRRIYCNNNNEDKKIGTISIISINHKLQVYQPNNPTQQNPQRPIVSQAKPIKPQLQVSPQVVQHVSPPLQSEISNIGKRNEKLPTCNTNVIQMANNEIPWLVFLYDSANNFLCGGTLVSNKHVVTAAHCAKMRLVKVELRSNNVIVRFANEIRKQGDIAILILVETVNTLKFPPVCIWPFGRANDITKGIAVSTNQLNRQKIDVDIVSQENCSAGSSTQNLCVGGPESCKGVPGGGMYVERGGRVYLLGILTSGPRNNVQCNADEYISYTDISLYEDWLKQNMQ